MAKKFSWRQARLKLIATFLSSFSTPLIGTQIVLQPAFIESVYVALISSVIMTIAVAGQIFDKASKVNGNGTS